KLDFREPADGLFAPVVNARLGFLIDVPGHGAHEIASVVERSRFAHGWTRHRLDHVAAQQLRPVGVEKFGRGEDVAPRDLAAERDDYAHNALTLQAGCRAVE